jgi:hypothetical protein
MWSEPEKNQGLNAERSDREELWPCAETFKSLTQLNEACLELLVAQAALGLPAAAAMLSELADLWGALDVNARRRAAACPYLLVDAGFADAYRWRWVGANRVADREPAVFATFFTASPLSAVAHHVFNYAWYLTRSQPMCAPLFLGMPMSCASLLRGCSMRQITELAERNTGWLRPRWVGRVHLWRELLLAAISGERLALEKAQLRGVQLLAGELKSLELAGLAEGRPVDPRNYVKYLG